ncbi:hypothetical protein R50073_36280 [Maricurvus nonylphenolicus]|uniref:acetoacetate decarboxylase family protein n=1 Tax=Maricurvus nonylphenolicus TaxID=1008307 RepID=UPI0036F24118
MNKYLEDFDEYETQSELWRDSHMITADVRLNPEAAKKVLPMGLRLTDSPTATLFIVDYKQPNFTAPYREAAMLIHVKTLFSSGLHCCWMTVDDDTAMIYGRELLGYPKKMADIDYEESSQVSEAKVHRRGKTVLSMRASKGEKQSMPSPVFDRKMYNTGGLGNFTLLQGLWLSRSKERIIESYSADIQIELVDSLSDPIKPLIADTTAINPRIVNFDIIKGKYLLPVGLSGISWYQRTSHLRVR